MMCGTLNYVSQPLSAHVFYVKLTLPLNGEPQRVQLEAMLPLLVKCLTFRIFQPLLTLVHLPKLGFPIILEIDPNLTLLLKRYANTSLRGSRCWGLVL